MPLNLESLTIKPEDFLDENSLLVPESGIEDRYNTFIHDVCKQITSYKDDLSDGVIRVKTDHGIYYGIQEAKKLDKSRFAFEATFMQALAYVAEFSNKYPLQQDKIKFVIMPTEKNIHVVMLDDINPFLLGVFKHAYLTVRLAKEISASKLYKVRSSIPDMEHHYDSILNNIRGKVALFEINDGLDYKLVVEHILNNLPNE